MPTGLLLGISAYLTIVDRAVLSLTSKRMWAMFGHDNWLLSLPSHKKLELLSLLERDVSEDEIGNILCRPCQIFHDPDLSWPSSKSANDREYNRPCRQEPANPRQRLLSPYLHRSYHFNLFKNTEAYRRSKESPYDVDQLYLVELPTSYGHENEKAEVVQTMTCRASKDGELIVKTVTDLSADKDDVHYLYQILAWNNLTPCCGHVDWEAVYPFIFQQNMQYPTDPKEAAIYGQLLARDDLMRIRDIWNPAVEPQLSLGNERMNACAFCYTNYTYEWRDVEKSRIVRLISYKNLGKGEDVNDAKWASHFNYRAYLESGVIRRNWWDGFHSTYAWDEPDESERKAQTGRA
ncbi:hypothetical protein JMJ77_0010761 [Colletotrichum scovillei]|uniref:F-box domain-containing protein n=1 Tax=Colletotrichum scovillei TaxID=1209932 RepID=A0A9P7U9E1_9PEZI|nr:hypothetical protein JMJ77_0010761 [Colletotrichum scovillei]KAG7059725.1 hypothetical protein JMJ78_0015014 [Colletotrichum scovillei]KAG7067174.1 hypothetical protein JMJ76_0008617 [Colletotrichum scovillei]